MCVLHTLIVVCCRFATTFPLRFYLQIYYSSTGITTSWLHTRFMLLHCIWCGLSGAANPLFCLFCLFSYCPPHALLQTAYSAYSAQLLWEGLFIPPVSVYVVLRSSTAAAPTLFDASSESSPDNMGALIGTHWLTLFPSSFLCNRIRFMSINKRINYHWKAPFGDLGLDLYFGLRRFFLLKSCTLLESI